ncbi:MAG: biotin/lipoyl-binding protein [Pseudomonadota bacterium]
MKHQQLFIHLNKRAMEAAKVADLQFIMVNETTQLVHYRQAAFFNVSALDKQYKIVAASGLVSVSEDSPYAVWLNQFAKTFPQKGGSVIKHFSDAPAKYKDGWEEWLPDALLLIPLYSAQDGLLGLAMYAREQDWAEEEVAQLNELHFNYAYCLAALLKAKKTVFKSIVAFLSGKKLRIISLLLLVCLFIPVRLSALGPAEVIALNGFSVASPQDGVVGTFKVKPNAIVKTGDVLFTLDDTTVSNRYTVAEKALAIAKADALVAEQRAFDDDKSKGELASAMGRVREKEAELAAIEEVRSRVEVKAERDGIAVFADENDWIGKPVQTGERVLFIANPKDAGLLMWLPVSDAINLELGAPMRLFLNTQPLQPISAQLIETSYQASLSPQNVMAYRVKGAFINTSNQPRIGLHGTARISGKWTTLGYYVFRRPISALRAWTGL